MHRSRFLAKTTALSVAGVLVALPAFAQTGQPQIEQLMQQLETQKKMMDNISRELEKVRTEQTKQAATGGGDVEVTTKGGLAVKSKDGNFEFKVGGRLQADYNSYDQDKTELGDGTEFRRVRIDVEGKMFKDWAFKIEPDFANNGVSLKDVYLQYKGFSDVGITVGQFKQPFSLEELTSSRHITFMERALPNVFSLAHRIGVGFNSNGDNWSAGLAFAGGVEGNDVSNEGDESYTTTARLTFAPIHGKTEAIHLGVAGSWINPRDEAIRIRQRPEAHVTSVRFVDTGTIPGKINNQFLYGFETAAVYGPFSAQGEYMTLRTTRDTLANLSFDGWYGYLSFFLTGESRTYDPKKGRFDRLKPTRAVPDGGYGAWEVALRYSGIDLTDEDINGGGEKNVTLALNWYPTPYVRLMANYIWVNNDNKATGSSAPLLPGETFRGDDDPQIFLLRAQVDF